MGFWVQSPLGHKPKSLICGYWSRDIAGISKAPGHGHVAFTPSRTRHYAHGQAEQGARDIRKQVCHSVRGPSGTNHEHSQPVLKA
jgi:hypothetical protein